ncbi:unnamed protein product [Penicillium glandicola]
MFEFLEGQESKTVPCCHDLPPKYDSCQPSQDVLTSVIENEHTRRILLQRLDKVGTDFLKFGEKKPTESDDLLFAEYILEAGQLFKEGMNMSTELANVYKERSAQNTELCTAMSRLTDSEFNRTYASLRRDPNRQMRHKMAQDHQGHKDCGSDQIKGAGDSPCSYDPFFELSAKVDKINDKLSQSLQSHDAANISKTTDDALAKPPRSFWRRIFKHPVRP